LGARRHGILTGAFCLALSLTAALPAMAEQSYVLNYEGAPDGLTEKLKIISELEKAVRDYPTASALRRAARRDVDAFNDALKAAGYFAGKTSFRLTADEGDQKPHLVFEIHPGPAFVITEYEIIYRDEVSARPHTLADAKITTDGAATGAALQRTQRQFLTHLWETGFPAAEIVSRRAIADLKAGTAKAQLVFNSGPKANFGALEFSGLTKTNEAYMRKLKTWSPGEEFERSAIVAYRDRLAGTGLFSTINVAPGAPDETGAAPILTTLEERKRRTIGGGLSYSTVEGPGGRLYFENRNIFGQGESLRIEMRAAKIEQSINFNIAKPLPGLPGQAFGNLEFANQTTDAFDARTLSISSGLAKMWFDNKLETSAALGLETSNVKSDGGEERTYFVSTPLSATWNSENDPLDPKSGFRANWTVTPYSGSDAFTQSEISARSRINFGGGKYTLAGRAVLGATFGSSLADLPLNKRFYAGGGGSVRGFSFQEAGPLDANNIPVGGRSLIESAIEARVKVHRNIQLVGFIDAGSVSPKSLPDFNERYFVGVGGGARYLTPIGPVRLDVAFPLERRESDRAFQIFIALGQPF